ncbi:DUF835 domain-containing protein [Thermococcus sp.]|uniref:DUF835 domain-containing protein n=1 Tax=Thermococcus sp. TaxID=35749 RepID=UPI0026318264|nr:DUF835 domain-containing protein [Thermococcus sp.]
MDISPDLAIITLKGAIGLVFLWVFIKSRRRSALFLGAGWVLSGNLPLGGTVVGGRDLDPLIMGLSTSITIFGIMELITEERGRGPPRSLLLSLPPVPLVYGAIETALGMNFGGTYIVSGFLLIAGGGTFIEFLKDYYRSRAVLFGATLILAGIASMAYPFIYLRGDLNYSLVVYGSVFLAALTIFAYYRLVSSENFLYFGRMENAEDVDVGPGPRIVSPHQFEEIAKKLNGFPVLAFLRGTKPGEGWIVYRISTVGRENVIEPSALYRITQTVEDYLREAERTGVHGIVVLEGLELMKMYNGFESLLKFLSTLGDMVRLSGASLLVITEREVWSKSEWRLLHRMLE